VKEKNKAIFCQLLCHCGSDDEYDLEYISVTSFCLFCVVEHRVLKMTFHYNVKKNYFIFQPIFPHLFRYTGWPEGPETDIVASSDNVSHLIYRVFR